MDRRTLIAAPLLALPGLAWAQDQDTPAPPATPSPPPAGQRPMIPTTFPRPTLTMTTVASGLHFPEGPVVMKDGSVLFVQIEAKQISRLKPDGTVELVAQLEGGPNGLAIGPDKALYIANDGGRFSFRKRGDYNFPGGAPPDHVGGSIQRMDHKTGRVTTLYDSCDGKRLVAPDDLVFDHHGNMWISDYGKVKGDGGIYFARADGKGIKQAKGGMTSPNGIGLSPNGKKLHVSEGNQLLTFDITDHGILSAGISYANAFQGALPDRTIADSLKVQADGQVCVCTLFAGGISVFNSVGKSRLIQFNDPFTTNLAFGGKDMRDVWVTSSGLGQIVRVRWPSAGLKPAYTA